VKRCGYKTTEKHPFLRGGKKSGQELSSTGAGSWGGGEQIEQKGSRESKMSPNNLGKNLNVYGTEYKRGEGRKKNTKTCIEW